MDYFLLSYLHGVSFQLYVGGIEGTDSAHAWMEGVEEFRWATRGYVENPTWEPGKKLCESNFESEASGYQGGKNYASMITLSLEGTYELAQYRPKK